MDSEKKNVVIVFHSYPSKPCIDGLMSAIITSTLYKSSNIALVPYWRTDESFQRIKKTLSEIGQENTGIIYVDCTPDLENEVDYLTNIIDDVPVHVYDHHPRKDDSPINRLLGNKNFKFIFDADRCATEMMYAFLSHAEKRGLDAENLVKIVQFSEYEGMNPKVAGKDGAEEISLRAFQNALKRTSYQCPSLHRIMEQKMCLYYVLDNILATAEKWKFLYDHCLGYQDTFTKFQFEANNYLKFSHDVVYGESTSTFAEEEASKYLNLLKEMNEKLEMGRVLKRKTIGCNICDVFVVKMNIFTFGRSLEPAVRTKLKTIGAQYAVLMNSPSTNKQGQLSYYFSLRRGDEKFDARELAKFIMNVTGNKIGGGHPWASGVTLTEEEYKTFTTLSNEYIKVALRGKDLMFVSQNNRQS